jgi:hypothetical protein
MALGSLSLPVHPRTPSSDEARSSSVPPVAGPPTVRGVPLQPGERVVFFEEPDDSAARSLLLTLGILTLPIAIGIAFLLHRRRLARTSVRALVITTQRALVVYGSGASVSYPLGELPSFRAIRSRRRRHGADAPKYDPGYWHFATGIEFCEPGGRTAVKCRHAPEAIKAFGLLLACGVWRRGFALLPTVRYAA